MPAATRKHKRDTQSYFDSLHKMANARVMQVEEDIVVELEMRFQSIMAKMKGVDLARRSTEALPGESS